MFTLGMIVGWLVTNLYLAVYIFKVRCGDIRFCKSDEPGGQPYLFLELKPDKLGKVCSNNSWCLFRAKEVKVSSRK